MTGMPRIQTHHDSRLFRRMRNRNLSPPHFVFSPPLSLGQSGIFPPPPRRQTVVRSFFLLSRAQMLFGDSLSFKSPRRKDIRQLQQSNRLIPLIMRFSLIKRNEEAPSAQCSSSSSPSVVRGGGATFAQSVIVLTPFLLRR